MFNALAATALLIASPLVTGQAAQKEHVYAYNAGTLVISMACTNPGAVYHAGGDAGLGCDTGNVWLRNPSGAYKIQQTNKLGFWFDWKDSKGWKIDDDGGTFRLVHD